MSYFITHILVPLLIVTLRISIKKTFTQLNRVGHEWLNKVVIIIIKLILQKQQVFWR